MKKTLVALCTFTFCFAFADLKVGDDVPKFQVKTDKGESFNIDSRKGSWTVLYFYPKANTPGCTKQAIAFQSKIEKIKTLGAEVYGISADDIPALQAFKKDHDLKFTMLSDTEMKAISAFGAKMPLLPMSNRWTFVIDPKLKIASIDRDVDPVSDPDKVAKKIAELKTSKK
jgi:peroxiredoxin Q/BCP